MAWADERAKAYITAATSKMLQLCTFWWWFELGGFGFVRIFVTMITIWFDAITLALLWIFNFFFNILNSIKYYSQSWAKKTHTHAQNKHKLVMHKMQIKRWIEDERKGKKNWHHIFFPAYRWDSCVYCVLHCMWHCYSISSSIPI